jgi:uncharacterized protein (DUF736 family)
MMIGKFTQSGEGYEGEITGFALKAVNITISPMPVKQGNGPDFVVSGTDAAGQQYEIGAAWKRVSEKKGKQYLSVKLDGPTLAAPVNCALIEQSTGRFNLVWSRDSRKEEEQAAA